MTNYNDGKWHGWNGGECPIHVKSKIGYVWFSHHSGASFITGQPAGAVYWEGNDYGNLIAFHVMEEYKEPAECWINIYPNGVGAYVYTTKEEAAYDASDSDVRQALFREVIE